MTAFGTILVDPPWNYAGTSRHHKLTGYTDEHYAPLTTNDLAALPLGAVGTTDSVLLVWTTFPFVGDALRLIEAWDYDYVTGLAWVKTQDDLTTVSYGVGYWFRGAVELLMVGKRAKAYRTNWTGLISPGLRHSRKPESVYELAESFPGPRLEVFARLPHPGWYALGDGLEGDGADIRERLPALVAGMSSWDAHYCPDDYRPPPRANEQRGMWDEEG